MAETALPLLPCRTNSKRERERERRLVALTLAAIMEVRHAHFSWYSGVRGFPFIHVQYNAQVVRVCECVRVWRADMASEAVPSDLLTHVYSYLVENKLLKAANSLKRECGIVSLSYS